MHESDLVYANHVFLLRISLGISEKLGYGLVTWLLLD